MRLEPSPETQAEAKATKEILATATTKSVIFDQLLDKHQLPKLGVWTRRFITNCRKHRGEREVGPIKTSEIKQQRLWWIRWAQTESREDPYFQGDQIQLNLQLNEDQVLECQGRIVGECPIYLPDVHPFTAKVAFQAHLSTIHRGVGITIAKIRECYWVPQLRRLIKKITKNCKRFKAKAYQVPPPGNLPTTRTQGTTPYQVIGVDFAGPIWYCPKSKKEVKAYLAL